MNINKKIVICFACRFFPTKEDQNSNALDSRGESILWRCQACKIKNTIPKSEFIMLPETNYLKIPINMVLNNQSSMQSYQYLVVIHCSEEYSVAYSYPQNGRLLQEHIKIDLSLLENVEMLKNKSEWFKEYRHKKKTLQKFGKIINTDNRMIFKDEYLIYLLHLFLKTQLLKISKNNFIYRMEVDLILKVAQKIFSFHLQSIQINQSNKQLSEFIFVYLLVSLNLLSGWAAKMYLQDIANHKNYLDIKEKYCNVLIMSCEDSQTEILMKEEPNFDIINNIKDSIFRRAQINEQLFSKFKMYPLGQNSFIKYLLSQKEIESSSCEYIDIFWKQRRSQVLQKETITDDLQTLKIILLNNKGYNLGIDESELKKLILQRLEEIRGNTFIKPVKLYANLNSNGSRMAVLYTFQWDKIQTKTIYESFEEPTNYQDVLKEDVWPDMAPKRKPFNPFSKKQNIQSVDNINKEEEEQQNEDDYICL